MAKQPEFEWRAQASLKIREAKRHCVEALKLLDNVEKMFAAARQGPPDELRQLRAILMEGVEKRR